ncbi:MAG: TetR/AcrR family transcriptional regulator [Desulfosalsimonadaceae bacterium]
MQVLDDQKKETILAAAAKLFASEPFHKVLLSDVAEAAKVGKGTLYTYFKSKEDLYLAVISQGFAQLLTRLRERIVKDAQDALGDLAILIEEYVNFAFKNPYFSELMRTVPEMTFGRPQSEKNGQELSRLIESLIRQGIATGQFTDPHPELTTKYLQGLLRSVFTGDMNKVERKVVTEHITQFIHKGLSRKDS